jgi:predicted nucleotidyltransferase
MQFAYQFPERTDRLVLVGSGGLGTGVTGVLRALTLPGAGTAIWLSHLPPARLATAALRAVVGLVVPAPLASDIDEALTVHAGLRDPGRLPACAAARRRRRGGQARRDAGGRPADPRRADRSVMMPEVRVVSDSRSTDGSLRALVDAAEVAEPVRRWLVVGGTMVNLHVLHSGLDLPTRPTGDVDLAVTLRTVRQGELVRRLIARGYRTPTFPNRFERHDDGLDASIDLVVQSYFTTVQPNMDGDLIAVDGMPVVGEALDREPVLVEVEATFTDGARATVTARIPDIASAIAMKTFALAERSNPHDAVDLGHLLQIAREAGLESQRWPRGKAFAAAKVQLAAQFDRPGHALALATASPTLRVRLRDIAALLAET